MQMLIFNNLHEQLHHVNENSQAFTASDLSYFGSCGHHYKIRYSEPRYTKEIQTSIY